MLWSIQRAFRTSRWLMGSCLMGYLILPNLGLPPSSEVNASPIEALKGEVTFANPHPLTFASKTPQPQLPAGVQANWTETALDGGKVHIELLRTGLPLSQTRYGLGEELFHHYAYIFRQLSRQIPYEFSHLEALADQAEHMGLLIGEAGNYRFQGLPTSELTHLQVRSRILSALEAINAKAVEVQDQVGTGQSLMETGKSSGQPGPALEKFLMESQRVLASPALEHYPETRSLLSHMRNQIKALGLNLKLRWITVFQSAEGPGREKVIEMRIFTVQNLSASESAFPGTNSLRTIIHRGRAA